MPEQVYHRNIMRDDLATISVIYLRGDYKVHITHLSFVFALRFFFSFSIVHLEAYKMFFIHRGG